MIVNLHTHLEGCVRPATAEELARDLDISEPKGGWENAFRIRGRGDLTMFLSHVAQSYPLFSSRENLRRLAYEAVQDAALDGQSYIELRFGPGTHARHEISIEQVLKAVCGGVADAVTETGIRAGVIACMLRHESQDMVEAIAAAAVSLVGEGVVGLDIAGDEILYPELDRFVPIYKLAKDAGLGLTAHAAEAGPASAGRFVVEKLGVSRIGHGSRIADDPDMLTWIRDNDIAIEVCPTSNVLTGAAASLREHPIHTFVTSGIPVVLGDDNPENTGVRLSEEAQLLVSEGGFNHKILKSFAANSVRAAFCSTADRVALEQLLAKDVV